MDRLNREQMSILEDNFDLINGYLLKRKLEECEFHSLVTDSLVKAILVHDGNKSKLSTLFYRIADNDVAYMKRNKPVEILGFKDDFSSEYRELVGRGYKFASDDYFGEEEESREKEEILDVSEYLSCLREFEIKICNMLYEGKTQREIAKDFGVSQQSISKRIRIIRKRLKEEVENGNGTETLKKFVRQSNSK